MMTRFLCLLALLIAPSVADAATYFADPAGGAAESSVNGAWSVTTGTNTTCRVSGRFS